MSLKENFVDTATGASPPWSSTRDVACSPIYFGSSIEFMPVEDVVRSSIIFNQEKQKPQTNVLINKNSNNEHSSSLSLPLSNSSSSNTTPILSAASSIKPVSLMSIELNDVYDTGSTTGSSSVLNKTKQNRPWPVDLCFRRDWKHHQRRIQAAYHSHFHSHQGYDRRSATTTRSNYR
ncbi:unnamed protein product [Rotaria sordida]|uniref:Uncharacterized protein n=1 Tax=Rotaria sordida TaxID=392033 RepID=A0A815RG83_9BILA|nr:unnamed protein product [Rotaria sordida]CAF1476753.1 unnamed protein product [Rotaria sordida]